MSFIQIATKEEAEKRATDSAKRLETRSKTLSLVLKDAVFQEIDGYNIYLKAPNGQTICISTDYDPVLYVDGIALSE